MEGAAHHAYPLCDSDEAQAAALGGLGEGPLDLEAHPVVGDLHLDRASARTQPDDDGGRARVLADVGEGLLDRSEHRDALRRRERVRVAPDLERDVRAAALPEVVDLAMEDLAEGAADDALRLERVRQLTKLAVELGEAGGEVVEAPERLLAVALEDEGIDLLLEEPHVGGEREDVLDGAVVEIEAEAHQPPLGGADERALALDGVLEELLALDDRAERRGDLRQKRVRDLRIDRAEPAHDGRIWLAEAVHGRRAECGAAEEREPRAAT